MKLLLALPEQRFAESLLDHFNVVPESSSSSAYAAKLNVLHHEVTVLYTGHTLQETAYRTTKVLQGNKFHLALLANTGTAYRPDLEIGQILNVVNEKPVEQGESINGEWNDFYALQKVNAEQEPHVRGGFINLTNAYMNVFLPYKKVVGVTVNHVANKAMLELRRNMYKVDCETTNALGFTYACLAEKQLHYHLCVVERNLATDFSSSEAAVLRLSQELITIVAKL